MVVRTGLNTCMGSMLRQLIAPTRLQKEASPFVQVKLNKLTCWAANTVVRVDAEGQITGPLEKFYL